MIISIKKLILFFVLKCILEVPYNSGCVLELIKFLVDACDPHDQQNTEVMIGVGLNLLVIAFEVGAYAIKCHTNMHSIIKDQLCRNILSVCTFIEIFI